MNKQITNIHFVKNGDWVKLKGAKYTIKSDGIYQNDCWCRSGNNGCKQLY